MNLESKLEELYSKTYLHTKANGGGTYPYKNYSILKELVTKYKVKRVLECGTAQGLTAIAMCLGNSEVEIISIDKEAAQIQLANLEIKNFSLENRIKLIQGEFKKTLPEFKDSTFDLVFFDGFSPGLTVFLELERILKVGGIMACANLYLGGDKRKITRRMHNKSFYEKVFQVDDTLIGFKHS